MSIAFAYYYTEPIGNLLGQHSLYSLFKVIHLFVTVIEIIVTIPALYYLISYYPFVVQDHHLHTPKQPWVFSINMILGILCLINSVKYIGYDNNVLLALALQTLRALFWGLKMVSFFMIGTCMDQMRYRLEEDLPDNVELKIFSQKMASSKLKEYCLLKAGVSPLLFCIFNTNVMLIIVYSLQLLRNPVLSGICKLAFMVWDLFYITITIDKTHESLQVLLLKLR